MRETEKRTEIVTETVRENTRVPNSPIPVLNINPKSKNCTPLFLIVKTLWMYLFIFSNPFWTFQEIHWNLPNFVWFICLIKGCAGRRNSPSLLSGALSQHKSVIWIFHPVLSCGFKVMCSSGKNVSSSWTNLVLGSGLLHPIGMVWYSECLFTRWPPAPGMAQGELN